MLAGAVLAAQISAPAIVARVKQQEARIADLSASVELRIASGGETRTRRFELRLLRDGVDYLATVSLTAPAAMAGTRFLIHAARGKRNREWAYFPDLDLVRSIPGKQQDDPFLGSDLTFADLAGGAHLDDLVHERIGEEDVDGEPCYLLEGVPRRKIVYGKLRGFVRQADFVTVRAEFYDPEGALLKTARLSDVRELADGALLAHRVEVESAVSDSVTVLIFDDVRVNQGLPAESFTEAALKQP